MASRFKKIGKKVRVNLELILDVEEIKHWDGHQFDKDDYVSFLKEFKGNIGQEILEGLKYDSISKLLHEGYEDENSLVQIRFEVNENESKVL